MQLPENGLSWQAQGGVGVGSLSDSVNLEPSQDLSLDRSHRNPQCLLEQAAWEVQAFLPMAA